jgi:hypothetical protein
MGLCVGASLVHLVVHGCLFGKKSCSLGRSWGCVWELPMFPWSFMDGHVCGKGPSFLGRSWPCVWQGASFHWSFMDGHVCGKVPRSLGRSWACVWQGASFPWSFMGVLCGKMPCSHRYPDCVACHDPSLASLTCILPLVVHGWACVWQGALFPWSFMGMCVARCLVPLVVHGWACVWQDALFP